MTIIGAQQAIELLEKQVKGREDYIYIRPLVTCDDGEGPYRIPANDCVYSTPEGEPSCLVGHVLRDVLDDGQWAAVHAVEYDDYDRFLYGVPILHLEPAREKFDEAALAVLRAAQNVQDVGATWGEALAEAKKLVQS